MTTFKEVSKALNVMIGVNSIPEFMFGIIMTLQHPEWAKSFMILVEADSRMAGTVPSGKDLTDYMVRVLPIEITSND